MVLVLCLALLAASPGQTVSTQSSITRAPQPPPRDAAKEKGTGLIKGKVVAADSGRAMRRVQVSLSSPDLSEARSMSTTAAGLFEFKDLPAGRYTISASRTGYLRLQYGQRRPGEPGRPLQLADGERFEKADIALPRVGTISGRITDELGDPLPDVSIFAAQWKYFRGKRRMVPVASGMFNRTDDTGQYRISGLEPGEYFVLATTRTMWTVDDKPSERIGFAPTYSGGTANPADAMRVKVAMGQETNIGDIAMVPGRAATITGMAVYSSGQPLAGENVEMMQEFAGPTSSSSFGMSGAKVQPDGSFTIKNVAPGEYRLSIRGPGDKEHPPEGATQTVSVSGDDVGGIMLVAGSGVRCQGESSAIPARPSRPRRTAECAWAHGRSIRPPPTSASTRTTDA